MSRFAIGKKPPATPLPLPPGHRGVADTPPQSANDILESTRRRTILLGRNRGGLTHLEQPKTGEATTSLLQALPDLELPASRWGTDAPELRGRLDLLTQIQQRAPDSTYDGGAIFGPGSTDEVKNVLKALEGIGRGVRSSATVAELRRNLLPCGPQGLSDDQRMQALQTIERALRKKKNPKAAALVRLAEGLVRPDMESRATQTLRNVQLGNVRAGKETVQAFIAAFGHTLSFAEAAAFVEAERLPWQQFVDHYQGGDPLEEDLLFGTLCDWATRGVIDFLALRAAVGEVPVESVRGRQIRDIADALVAQGRLPLVEFVETYGVLPSEGAVQSAFAEEPSFDIHFAWVETYPELRAAFIQRWLSPAQARQLLPDQRATFERFAFEALSEGEISLQTYLGVFEQDARQLPKLHALVALVDQEKLDAETLVREVRVPAQFAKRWLQRGQIRPQTFVLRYNHNTAEHLRLVQERLLTATSFVRAHPNEHEAICNLIFSDHLDLADFVAHHPEGPALARRWFAHDPERLIAACHAPEDMHWALDALKRRRIGKALFLEAYPDAKNVVNEAERDAIAGLLP